MPWGDNEVLRTWHVGTTASRTVSLELQRLPSGKPVVVLVAALHGATRATGIVVHQEHLERLGLAIGEAFELTRGGG